MISTLKCTTVELQQSITKDDDTGRSLQTGQFKMLKASGEDSNRGLQGGPLVLSQDTEEGPSWPCNRLCSAMQTQVFIQGDAVAWQDQQATVALDLCCWTS